MPDVFLVLIYNIFLFSFVDLNIYRAFDYRQLGLAVPVALKLHVMQPCVFSAGK